MSRMWTRRMQQLCKKKKSLFLLWTCENNIWFVHRPGILFGISALHVFSRLLPFKVAHCEIDFLDLTEARSAWSRASLPLLLLWGWSQIHLISSGKHFPLSCGQFKQHLLCLCVPLCSLRWLQSGVGLTPTNIFFPYYAKTKHMEKCSHQLDTLLLDVHWLTNSPTMGLKSLALHVHTLRWGSVDGASCWGNIVAGKWISKSKYSANMGGYVHSNAEVIFECSDSLMRVPWCTPYWPV